MGKMRKSDPSDVTGFTDDGYGKMQDFGFSGSIEAPAGGRAPASGTAKSFAKGGPACYAEGGSVRHSDGSVEHRHTDGSHSMHHAKGGMTHTAADGTVTEHHHGGGHTIHHAHGGTTHVFPDGHVAHHDASEFAHRGMPIDDEAADKALVAKGVSQHEDHEHGGNHTELHLRHGGGVMKRLHAMGTGQSMPINRPPSNPMVTRTPPNVMPGGQMAYGVQPSTEPDDAGSDQPGTPMRRGGRMHKR